MKSNGRCLCGAVTWTVEGEPASAYHCHCKMCRKAHGAAFGTYYYFDAAQFTWTSKLATVGEYQSSANLARSFCKTCGSVVPNAESDGSAFYVPAGSHDDGAAPNCHIFVAHKAPWHDITDNLPRYDDYPPGIDAGVIAEKTLADAEEGIIRGSCLCGAVEFRVIEPFKVVHNCHCSRCRQARAAAHTTNGFTSIAGVEFVKGEEHAKSYKLPGAKFFTHVFCDQCGSGLPRLDPERNIAVTPLGSLDDDPKVKPVDHIFVASKSPWYDVGGDLPRYDEGPPS